MLAGRFASPQVVLPWVYHSIGGPLFLIGFLIPSVRAGGLVSQFAVVPRLRALPVRKWLNVSASLAIAGLLALIGFSATSLSIPVATSVFLGSAVGLGLCNGIVNLSSQEVMGKVFPGGGIARLVSVQSSVGGFLTLALALGLFVFDPDPNSQTSHLTLVWIAAVMWVAAAVCMAAAREQPSQPQAKRSVWSEARQGFALYGRSPWFLRYTVTRILFLSVGLATPFYSIHAATLYQGSVSSVSLFVIATGLASMLSGAVWGGLLRKSPKLVMALAGLVAVMAGGVALAHGVLPHFRVPYLYAIVLALLALAVQGLDQAYKTYVLLSAPAVDRPLYLAVNNTLLGFLAIGVAAILGAVAHMTHIAWALVVIIAITLAACASTAFLIEPESR
jgi:hypothetical protein